jgi:hypothetical protein
LEKTLSPDCPVAFALPAARRRASSGARAIPSKQRGEGKIKTILVLLVFAVVIFAGFRTIPAYVAEFQLADKMQEVARFAVATRQSDEQIRESIYRVMQDLDIPAKKEDIKVISTERGVSISLDYRVPVDLLVFQTELHFTPSSENKSLT